MQRRSPASCKRSTTCARRSARPSKVSAPLRKLTCPIGRFPVSDFDSSFEAGQLAALFKPKLTSDPNRRGADMLLRSMGSRRAGDRKSVVEGKGVLVRVDLGWGRIIKKKTTSK